MTSPSPRWSREILVAGVWCASAISVSGYTYKAFKNALNADTAAGTSGTGPPAIPTNSAAEGKKGANKLTGSIPLIGKPLTAAANWLQNIFSPRVEGEAHLTGDQIARLQSLPGPPAKLVSSLREANRGNGDLATAANAFASWSQHNGWKGSDVNNFFTYLGIKVF